MPNTPTNTAYDLLKTLQTTDFSSTASLAVLFDAIKCYLDYCMGVINQRGKTADVEELVSFIVEEFSVHAHYIDEQSYNHLVELYNTLSTPVLNEDEDTYTLRSSRESQLLLLASTIEDVIAQRKAPEIIESYRLELAKTIQVLCEKKAKLQIRYYGKNADGIDASLAPNKLCPYHHSIERLKSVERNLAAYNPEKNDPRALLKESYSDTRSALTDLYHSSASKHDCKLTKKTQLLAKKIMGIFRNLVEKLPKRFQERHPTLVHYFSNAEVVRTHSQRKIDREFKRLNLGMREQNLTQLGCPRKA